jgi:hypothetical protein
MSTEFDERLDRAIAKHTENADEEAERLRLNGIAKKDTEKRQTDFLVAFSTVGSSVILPALRRVEEKLERAGQVGATRSDEIAALRRVAKAQVLASNEGEMGLIISREGKGGPHVSFRADPQLLKVVVKSNFGAMSPQQLDLQQVTSANIEALLGHFVELALEQMGHPSPGGRF